MNTVKELRSKIAKLQETLNLTVNIERRNKAFKKLSPPQKRVAIAKDVLKQLNMRRLIATRMTYVDVQTPVHLEEDDFDKDFSVFLPQIKQCNTCALGALFMGAVNQADNCKLDADVGLERSWARDLQQIDLGHNTHKYLKRFFSKQQLVLIENHYEQTHVSPLVQKHGAIYRIPGDVSARMLAIMKNIVKNKGTFVVKEFMKNGIIDEQEY